MLRLLIKCDVENCCSPRAQSYKKCRKHYRAAYKEKYGTYPDYKYIRSAIGRATKKKVAIKARLEALTHYSKGTLRCACCSESAYQFLTLDHINNNGAEHRRQINNTNLPNWLRKHGYPEGFQVLCMNCNFAKGKYGVCPHVAEESLCQYP